VQPIKIEIMLERVTQLPMGRPTINGPPNQGGGTMLNHTFSTKPCENLGVGLEGDRCVLARLRMFHVSTFERRQYSLEGPFNCCKTHDGF
jgi:hypothetical protein